MREYVRVAARRVAPALMAERARRYEQGLRESLGIAEEARAYAEKHGDLVEAGPFAGMRYPPDLLVRTDAPLAMLGKYEREVESAVTELVRVLRASPRSLFLDLGCADGYYAVGVAHVVPGIRVEASDLARSARAATRALARANDVTVTIRGRATARHLARLARETVAVLSDIEGAEVDVLTADIAKALAHAHLLIEVHEGARPGAGKVVTERFHHTHDVQTIGVESDMSELSGVREMRTIELRWAFCRPRAAGG